MHAETKPSVCPLDCPDTCSLSVTVEDGRIVRVRGSKANPYTAGVICEKVARYYPDFVHGENRLTRPLIRTGARGSRNYRAAGWDEALDLIHRRVCDAVERLGGETVLPLNYAGPHGKLAGGSMASRFFARLGATRLNRGPLCGAVRSTAYASLFGNAPGMSPEQAEHASLITVWGNNVTVSNLHFARVMKAARERGAKVVVVDPKRIRVAEQCHLHIQPRPGTDVVLALALAAEFERRNLVDEGFVKDWVAGYDRYMEAARAFSLEDAARICAIDAGDIEKLIELYGSTNRIAVSIGNGIERGRNGGSSLRAIMALSALRGAFRHRGAGVIAKHGAAFPYDDEALQQPHLAPAVTREINIVDTGRVLLDDALDPPITALVIFNHNPVCTHPDQNRLRRALAREDLFIVGIDVAMTDSMAYADVVLPASSHFEFDDVYGAYGQTWLQRAAPVIDPVGESLPNTEIFRRLASRFGFDEPAFADDDGALMRASLKQDDPRLEGIRPDELPLDRALPMHDAAGETPVPWPNTASGRIELFSDQLDAQHGCGVPRFEPLQMDYPLNLITPSSAKRTNSTFGGHADSDGPVTIEIHPLDAASRGIGDGQAVDVFNDLGRVRMAAKISDRVTPGVCYSPKGAWLHTSNTGQTVNALVRADAKADICGGACYNDTLVEITAAVGA
jgi:anaerobic selenocysteine-containing dehydrogenase